MEENIVNVLLIEDDEDDYILIDAMLKDIRGKKYNVEWLNSYLEAKKRVESDEWDVALVDFDLGPRNGLDLIRHAVHHGNNSPMIMVTGRGRYELDVEAMNSGAADYLSKDTLNSAVLERVIRYSIEHRRTKESLENLVQERTQELQNTLDELRVAEEELRTQHEELLQTHVYRHESDLHKQIISEFPLLEVITDREGKILDANPDASRLLSRNHESLEGKLLSLFIHIDDYKRFVHLLAVLQEEGLPRTEILKLKNIDGESPDWCLTVVPLKYQDIQINKYYWLIHPIYQAL